MRPTDRHTPARLRRFASSGLLGPIMTLVSGTAAAQAISYLARPALTRLFSPEAFGLFGLFLALIAVFGPLATAKYEDAIPVPPGDREAAATALLALLITTVITVLAMLLVPARGAIAELFGRPDLAPIIAVVPLGVAAAAWSRTGELWLTRIHLFRPIAAARAAQSGVAVPIQIVAGLAGTGALGLAGGYVAGRVVGMLSICWAVLQDGRLRREAASISRNALRQVLGRYRKFPLFSAPSGFLNLLSMQLPAFLLVALFDPAAAGFYAVAFATLAVPMQLVGASVGQVFFALAAEAHREGALPSLSGGIFRRLSAIGLFPMAAIMVAGPAAFALVFGAEWREAGVYAQMIAPWMFFVLVSAPLSNLFDVLERQDREMYFNILLLAARALALAAGALLQDARVAVLLFALVSAAFWVFHTGWMLRWSGVRISEASSSTGRHLLLSAPSIVLVSAAVAIGAPDGGVVLTMAAAAALAGVVFWKFEPALRP